ncbi:hypothetical protein [Aquimarina sp. MMG016]|uniref:hypothetical protein n=1 Tax=Aquimarina sp. MMG016 TaxID=2822690 RepID=UPI001B3A0044|nr:hypothetical protein [Aquimarina sp. MMG016]MBQ4819335.1 hypothetical protein [Aquimarina sp. MMG016]
MLKNILDLEGVQPLDQNEKKSVQGGNTGIPCNDFCQGGLCIMGNCYYVAK